MDIKLYYAPTTCALAPYITLTEAGADFETVALNFRKGEHKKHRGRQRQKKATAKASPLIALHRLRTVIPASPITPPSTVQMSFK